MMSSLQKLVEMNRPKRNQTKEKKEKKKSLPNSFLLFSNDQRKIIFQENPGVTNSEGK